jgi:hypothetical protein
LVIPAMVREAVVLLPTAHDAPAKVMVTTPPVVDAVAVQLVNPVPKTMVGVAGTVKAEGIVTVMVLFAASAPVDEVLKPTLQVETALAAADPGEKVTAVGGVAAKIVTVLGLAATVSCEVDTEKVVLV